MTALAVNREETRWSVTFANPRANVVDPEMTLELERSWMSSSTTRTSSSCSAARIRTTSSVVQIMSNTAATGATHGVDGGQQLV